MSTVSRRLSLFAATVGGAAVCVALATGSVGIISTNGVSMTPTFHTGDLVVVARADSYRIGQIVAYENPVDDDEILHRIVGGTAAAWDIRGDHNESIDVIHPSSDQLIGRAVLHVSNLGRFMTSPILLAASVLVAALLLMGLTTMHRKLPPSATTTSDRRPASSPTPGRRRLVGLLVLDALLLAAAAVAFAVPHDETASSPVAQQTGSFRYLATAARTATYPNGLIPTGTPVFTQLATSVDVSFDYVADLPEGDVTATAHLDAHVSNASGWSTVVPLAAPATMSAGALALTGELDLDKISDLADRVAGETGVNAGSISIVVTATGESRVHGAATVPFTFEMPMQLTPLTLTLAGIAPTETATGPAVISQQPLTTDVASPTSRGVPTNVRRALLVGLLLGLAATVALWPAARPPTDKELHRELAAASGGAR